MTILNSEGLYANGTRGIITKIKKNSITIKDINGKVINIHRKKIYIVCINRIWQRRKITFIKSI